MAGLVIWLTNQMFIYGYINNEVCVDLLQLNEKSDQDICPATYVLTSFHLKQMSKTAKIICVNYYSRTPYIWRRHNRLPDVHTVL